MTVSETRDALELLFEEETLILQMVAQLESRILQEIDERDLFRSQLKTYQDPELVKLYTRSDDKLSILSLEVLKFTGSHRVINKRIQDCLMSKRPMIKESYGAESVVSKWRLFSAAKPQTKKLRFPPPVPHKTHIRDVQDSSGSESTTVSLEPVDTGKPFLLTVAKSSETLVAHDTANRSPNQVDSAPGTSSALFIHEDDRHPEVIDQRMIQELKEYSKWKMKAHLLSKHATDSRHVFDMLEVAINEDLKSLLREKQVLRDKLAEQTVVLTDVANQRNLLQNILVKERDPRIAEIEHQLEIFAREKINLQEKNNLLEGNIRFYEFKNQELHQYTENMEMQIKSSSKSGKLDINALKHKSELEVKIKTMDKQIHELMYHNHNLRNHLDNLQKHGDTSSDAELAHTDSHVLQMTKKLVTSVPKERSDFACQVDALKMEPELRSCFSQTVMFNTESKATETTATWTEPQDIQSLKDELKSVCADRKKLQVDQALLVQRIETAEDDLLKARADLLEAVNLNDTTRNTFEEKTRLLDAMTVERNELKMSYLEKDNALRHLLEERDAVELKLSSMQKEDNAAEIDKLKETISSQNETLLILSKERDDSKTELVTCRQKLDLELVNLAQKTAKVKELDQFESFERDRVLILEKEREGYIAKELEIEATLNSTRADLETLRQESAELAKAKQDLTEQIKALSESLTKLGEEHSETQKSVNDSQKLLAELEVARLDVSARDKMKLDLEVRLEAALVSQAEKDEIMTKQTQELKVIQARVVDLDTQLNTMRVEHEAELDLADDRLESLLGKFELLEDTSRKLEQDYLEAKKEIALFKK